MVAKGKICRLCKHIYIVPCHGKNKKCQNKVWIETGKNWPHLENKRITKRTKQRVKLRPKKRVRLHKPRPRKRVRLNK